MKLAPLALVLILAGCVGMKTTTQEVPVAVPCNPPVVEEPALPIDGLSPDASIFDHVRALWASLKLQAGYAEQLKAASDSCRDK